MDEDKQPKELVIQLGTAGYPQRWGLPFNFEIPLLRMELENARGDVLETKLVAVNIVDGHIAIL